MAFLFSGLLGLILAVILSLYDFNIFWIIGLIAIPLSCSSNGPASAGFFGGWGIMGASIAFKGPPMYIGVSSLPCCPKGRLKLQFNKHYF